MLYKAITKATMYEANSLIQKCARGSNNTSNESLYSVYCLNISISCMNNFKRLSENIQSKFLPVSTYVP